MPCKNGVICFFLHESFYKLTAFQNLLITFYVDSESRNKY